MSGLPPWYDAFRPGDEIIVRMKVASIDVSRTNTIGIRPVMCDGHNSPEIILTKEDIVEHRPAPRPLVIGGNVRSKSEGHIAKLIAIDGQVAFIKWTNASHVTHHVSDLEPIA